MSPDYRPTPSPHVVSHEEIPGDDASMDEVARWLVALAGGTSWPATPTQQGQFRRAIRIATHPDRHFGNRAAWDRAMDGLKSLGLSA